MAHKNIYDVVVIGSGPAGGEVAVSCKKEGLKVALVECQKFICTFLI